MNLTIKKPLVAILRGIKPEEVIDHSLILVEAGFELIEIPTNSPNWDKSVTLLQNYWQDKIIVGAGTVITKEHVEQLAKSNAKLMVSPNTDVTLIRLAKQFGLITCIGAFTPGEMIAAQLAGADIIKVFPVNMLGSAYVKSIRSVLNKSQQIYAVGGVNPQNLSEYYHAGCQGFGLGSDLYKAGQTLEQTKLKSQEFMQSWENIIK